MACQTVFTQAFCCMHVESLLKGPASEYCLPFLLQTQTRSDFSPANNYVLKINNRNIWKRCEICSKSIKRHQMMPMTHFASVSIEQANVFWVNTSCIYKAKIEVCTTLGNVIWS